MLDRNCPELEVVAIASDAEEGMRQIKKFHPHLVFLDVEMPSMNGFEMLAAMGEIDFSIIFTTAFDKYAIRAIKFGALDYLLKPIDKDELRSAADNFLNKSQQLSVNQVSALLSHIKRSNESALQKIAFPTIHSYELVALDEIMVCESSSNYTKVKLANGQQMVVSRTLKDIEDLLDSLPFLRVHHSYLVNLNYATRYVKGEGGSIVLKDESTIPVARSKKDELLRLITQLPNLKDQ